MIGIELPPEDRDLSPYTGWTRDHWAAVADHLLLSLRPYFSATRARILLPGPTSSSGVDSDGFEGFARSFLLYAFRTAGEDGRDPLGLTEWYRDALLAGTDPQSDERWPAPQEVDQAKVEAASIALALQLTRPWLWDTFDAAERQRIVDWLAQAPAGRYPANNWLWFRITVETFLASVGGPHDPDRVLADLATIESYYRNDGWYADGALRAYDYYCGWAMQVYPLLWTRSDGSADLGSRALEPVFRGRLADFLDDYAALIGSDGMPVLQGRSLIYRFATAGPLWMGAITGATRLSPGEIRRAASGVLRAFVERGAINERGLLTLGLLGEWPAMAQSYSGSGSPYWASKGMLGLLLPADHPVWQATEEPLPVERGDTRRVIRSAGWLVSGTSSDGIVRVYNHGADHAQAGDLVGDSPIYARFGYSSATIPPLIGETIDSPTDNSVGVLDDHGRTTHRTGFERGRIGDDGTAAHATSLARTHWVDSSADDGPDHGSGRAGIVRDGPRLATASVVRGAWEVRAVRLLGEEGDASDPQPLRLSGWPLSHDGIADATVDGDAVRVESEGLVSELLTLTGVARASVHRENGTSPLGASVAVPWLTFDRVLPNETVIVAVRLQRGTSEPPTALARPAERSTVLEMSWPDGTVSTVALDADGADGAAVIRRERRPAQ